MTIRSAIDTFFAPFASNAAFTPPSTLSTRASWSGWFAAQSFCGARRIRAPLAPPRLSDDRKVEAEAQAVATSSAGVSPEARICAFSSRTSAASMPG
jgi:hypothetical protein